MARIGLLLAVCAIVIILVAAATVVTITKTTYAERGGFLLRPYFENANAPVTGCTAPCLTVDTQGTQPGTSGSFSLAAASNMYLWTPQFGASTSIPAGALSLQLFADLPAPALDGSASGTWTTGTSFSAGSLTTTHANDVVVLSIDTYTSGSSITVSSVSDSQAKVAWQGSARSSSISCSGTQETTHVEWYGIAATTVAADTITVTLSSTPTSASGIVFGVSGADTTTPFDPGSTPPKTAVGCLGLDAPCQGFGSSTTATVTTASITCAANDVIIVVITAGSANTVSSMTDSLGTHLTYTARCSNCDNHGSESIEEYYAITSSSATFTISATMSGTASYDIYAFGIKGANTATPFDTSFVANTLFTGHAGNGGSGGAPTVTGVTSTNANDMIIAMEGHPSGTLESASAPFALIGSANTANAQSIAAENEIVGAVQTAITVTFGTSIPTTAWSMLVDAVQAGTSAPTVTGVSTIADNDFIFSLFGAYLSVTETAGAIAGTTSTLVTTVAGVGDSNAVEYRAITTSQSSFSCAFGTSTMFWGVLCDALMPARQSVTISYATTNSAGTVQSSMIGGSAATITALYAPVSLSSSAGTVPASGYIKVVITTPAGTGLTVYWGTGKLTQFQVSYTYMSQ